MGDDVTVKARRGSYRDSLRSHAGWIVLGVVLSVLLLFAVKKLFAPVVFGLFLYYGTRPIYRYIKQFGVPDNLAAAVSLLALGLPFIVMLLVVVVTGLTQAVGLVEQGNLRQLEPLVRDLGLETDISFSDYSSISDFLSSEGFRTLLLESWSAVTSLTNRTISIAFFIFMSFISAFFMYAWGEGARETILELFDDDESVLESFMSRMDRDMASVFFGNIINAFVTAIIGAVAYTALNVFAGGAVRVPAPILLGVMTGLASLIPIVGSKIVYIPAAAIIGFRAFMVGGPMEYGFVLLFLGVALVVVDTLPDMILRPLISGRSTSQGAL
ncbi:MAG: AI-2E family transporter, partial [Candidatus Nanohaloarchaea archaeon]|nr:AI-2E family transporter [Candidatus Nanohaloarchaea archaeon]